MTKIRKFFRKVTIFGTVSAPVKHECDLIVFCKLDGENLSLKSSNGGLLSVNLNIKANK